jgi:hypothetical protein
MALGWKMGTFLRIDPEGPMGGGRQHGLTFGEEQSVKRWRGVKETRMGGERVKVRVNVKVKGKVKVRVKGKVKEAEQTQPRHLSCHAASNVSGGACTVPGYIRCNNR